MPLHILTINVCPDQGPCLEDWEATFDCIHERADRSVGFPGGWSCEFISAQIGGLKITRSMLEEITSRAEVDAIEERAAEEVTANGWAEVA